MSPVADVRIELTIVFRQEVMSLFSRLGLYPQYNFSGGSWNRTTLFLVMSQVGSHCRHTSI